MRYSRFLTLQALSRSVLPRSIRLTLRRWMFASLRLQWTTRSGIHLRIANYADFTIYSEIFVDGDYDQALTLAGGACTDALNIVDLGANTGFFTLRAFDRLLAGGWPRERIHVTAVEADTPTAADFVRRVHTENALSQRVRLLNGLVGRRDGQGLLTTDCWSSPASATSATMPYLNLSDALAPAKAIDLLKCDIEGAEQDFIESYRDILERTKVLVLEFHSRRCDIARCQALLQSYGFVNVTTLRAGSEYPVSTFWR